MPSDQNDSTTRPSDLAWDGDDIELTLMASRTSIDRIERPEDVEKTISRDRGEADTASYEAPLIDLTTTATESGSAMLDADGRGRPDGSQRYTLTRMHQQGGIGQVWLARDHHLDRDVALKRLKPSNRSHAATRTRFLREAWITGQLQHPGVVPIYELSDDHDGTGPYYTMKFIDGETMTEAARRYRRLRDSGQPRALALQELLGAFINVCQVIAYAHSRGVIHRDLKGQNIALGNFGEVMVLDWGLAKIETGPEPEPGQSPTEETSSPRVIKTSEFNSEDTTDGAVLGTAGFMSPEQAEGRNELVGPASDVYGLGAILYEILTAEPPFAGAKGEVLRRVVEEQPVPPGQKSPGIPRALEAICMKCLAKEPKSRYGSAAELARDVQRFLADEPVTAYDEPWNLRIRRWSSRHRTLVTATAATLLVTSICLAVAAVSLNMANLREAQARREAVANFKLANAAVERFFTKVGEDPRLKAHGLEKLRRDLLLEAKNFYESLDRDKGRDSWVGAERGWSYIRVAMITEELGEHDDAADLSNYARSIFENLLAGQPSSPDYLEGLARALDIRGRSCQEGNRVEDAKKAFEEAVAAWSRLAQGRREIPDDRYRLAMALNRLGRLLLISTSNVPEGREALAESLAITDKLVDQYPDTDEYQDAQAESFLHLGYQRSAGEFDVASKELERALAIRLRIAEKHRDSFEHQSKLLETCVFVATYYSNARMTDRVLGVNTTVLPLAKAFAAEHPDVILFSEHLALIESLSAISMAVRGDHGGATAAVEKALQRSPRSGRVLLYGACCFADASEAASKDPALSAPDRQQLFQRYQDRAMDLLRATQATGLLSQPIFASVLRTDVDLNSLRNRKDFQDLLAQLARRPPDR